MECGECGSREGYCRTCGECVECSCVCGTFDADELGLDPEEEWDYE